MNQTQIAREIARVRRLSLVLPNTSEKISHGEPTFFVHNKVFVMFADNHHEDGHIAVWLPVPPGVQASLIESDPSTFFYPPYVGFRGWVGIELAHISDADLSYHIQTAWELIAPKRLRAQTASSSLSAKSAHKKTSIRSASLPKKPPPSR